MNGKLSELELLAASEFFEGLADPRVRRCAGELSDHIDALATELTATKQALAAARGDVERVRSAILEGDDKYISVYEGLRTLRQYSAKLITANAEDWRQWAEQRFPAVDAVFGLNNRELPSAPFPTPANPAASERDSVVDRLLAPSKERLDKVREFARSVGRWPNALDYAEHKLTGNGGQCSCTMMGECVLHGDSQTCDRRCYADQLRDRLALERERFSPFAKANPAASEPADHSGDAGERVEPAERRFVCPKCGSLIQDDEGMETQGHEPLICGNPKCDWTGTWAEVEAAKGEGELVVIHAKTVDGKPLTYEQARELQRFVNEQSDCEPCPTMNAVKVLRLHFGFGLRQFAEMCGVKPSDWSDLEHGRIPLIVDSTLETALTKLAEATKGEREQENPCLGILDHKWLDPVCVGGGCQSLVLARVSEELKAEVEWRSLGIKSRDALILRLKQQLSAANQAREAAEQRAEAAKTAAGVMTCFVAEIRRLTYYYVCSHPETFHGEAKKALDKLDQALSQGEQR